MFIKNLVSLAIFLLVFLSYSIDYSKASCSILPCAGSMQTTYTDADNQNITQFIKQAVEFQWWTSKQNYREELSQFYAGTTLENIIESIAQFKEASTDWYSLTFFENCHIVYNNGNIAIAVVCLKDTDVTTNDTQQGRGVFILHKTNEGWRIIDLDCYWYRDNNQLSDREVTNF